MAKSTQSKTKKTGSTKRAKSSVKNSARAAENVDCLLELHKLQGVLLAQLKKAV